MMMTAGGAGVASAPAAGSGGMLARLVENSRAAVSEGVYDDPPPGRPSGPRGAFSGAIRRAAAARAAPVIAEIKFASPSMGTIREGGDPAGIARMMAAGGACALSVLTQPRLFGGSPASLAAVRAALPRVPILMKDVVVDARQVDAAHALGADCVLLMQSLFDRGHLSGMGGLVDRAHSLGLEVLAEAHTAGEFEHAAASGADLLGVNNRDLDTLEVDLGATARVLAGGRASLAGGRPVVSESGIAGPRDVAGLRAAGAGAFLVGTGIMSAAGGNVEKAVAGLVGAA